MDSLVSPRLKPYFDDYERSHRSRENKITHSIGIPLILIGLLGLASLAPMSFLPSILIESPYLRFDGSIALVFLAFCFYLYMDWKIAIPFLFVLLGLAFVAKALSWEVNLLCLIVGWIFQALGHQVFEKQKPAFFRNVMHLFIGPLWIFCQLLGYK